MRIIISENEIGLLYKNGIFQRLLKPGRQRIWPLFGETCVKMNADGRLDFPGMNLQILRQDQELEKSIAVIDVPDDHLAVHFIDGRIAEVLKPGTYAFWNIYQRHAFEIIDISDPESAGQLPVSYMAHMPLNCYARLVVNEGETGLLTYNGVFQRLLGAGHYYFWDGNIQVALQTVDLRVQQIEILGQEILTADKVSLRVNFATSFQITDPVIIVTRLKDYKAQIYLLAQLALREIIGKYRFDELLRQKDSLGALVLEKLKSREDEFFIKFSGAGVKDIILPGEIRDIMNTVLVAEKSAQASVITRREETAATKSLLETAKLMDENSTLYKLKELEYLERICDKVGNISLDSGGSILKNLRDLVGSKL